MIKRMILQAVPVVVEAVVEVVGSIARRYRRTPPDPETEARYERVSRHYPIYAGGELLGSYPTCLYCGVVITADNSKEHCDGPPKRPKAKR